MLGLGLEPGSTIKADALLQVRVHQVEQEVQRRPELRHDTGWLHAVHHSDKLLHIGLHKGRPVPRGLGYRVVEPISDPLWRGQRYPHNFAIKAALTLGLPITGCQRPSANIRLS